MTNISLRSLDIPSVNKFGIGFDSIFDDLRRGIAQQTASNYPPYNIVQVSEDEFMISLAVAGFGPDNLEVHKEKNMLLISGTIPDGDKDPVNFLFKGISGKHFQREFKLADYVEIVNAHLELGILNIHLKREVPEEKKLKKIEITYTK